jgi:tetratricopeptide (TPR) repeat protein
VRPVPPRVPVARVAAAVVALVLAVAGGAWWLARSTERAAVVSAREPVSILIADFENQTGDPVFGEALEQALAISVEGAPFVTSYRRLDAQRVATRNQLGTRLTETVARLVARREGINIVLAGSIQPDGSGYDIAVQVIDSAADRVVATATASPANKSTVLDAVTDLARQVREELGDTTLGSRRISSGETFTAASLDAVRSYAVAQDLAASGRHAEAVEFFRKAVQEDPNFGRAYSGWATSAFRLGRREEAERLWEKALSLMDRMTERERYRTLGTYYLGVARNYEKAIENYETLLKLYPADSIAANNLAVAYFYVLEFVHAQEAGRRAVAIYPENLTAHYNLALYAMYAGNFESAVAGAQQVVKRDANIPKAYLPFAVAALARGDVASARDAYTRMAKTGSVGASLAAIGLADLALYEGRFADAVATLEKGVEEDAKAGNTAGLAAKYVALGEAHLALDRPRAAVGAVEHALARSRQESVAVPAARILMESGRADEARKLATELSTQIQPQSRAYGKLIDGGLALRDRRLVDAIEAYGAARKLADLWLVRFNQGIAYVEAGRHAEGLADLELCLKRRGEATAVFLDDVPSFRYLVPLSYWLARAQEGVGMRANALQNYTAYLALRAMTPSDPLVTDARRRLESLAQQPR